MKWLGYYQMQQRCKLQRQSSKPFKKKTFVELSKAEVRITAGEDISTVLTEMQEEYNA